MSKTLQKFKEDVARELFGETKEQAQTGQVCLSCKGPAWQFADELSRKEYQISGMCQKCQNEIFG